MAIIIECCNNKLRPDEELRIKDYPHKGDIALAHPAICPTCHVRSYMCQIHYLFDGIQPLQRADKHRRQGLDQQIAAGNYAVVEKGKKEDRPTRGEPIVGDYTKKICRPAEDVAHYLEKVKQAELGGVVSISKALLFA